MHISLESSSRKWNGDSIVDGFHLVSSSVGTLNRYQLGWLCCFLIWVVGCEPDQGFSKVIPESDPGEPDIEFSLDIALQRSSWGQSVGRCHLQAALRTLKPKEDDMAPYGEAHGTVIELPEEPMDCAHTALEDAGGPVEVGSAEDNWAIEGDEIAAAEIHLISDEQLIVLVATELETGSVRYEWDGCSQDSFPFGQVFDLHLPTAEDVLISGFTVEEAFAVGPDLVITDPIPEDTRVVHSQDQDLTLAWSDLDEMPVVRGESVQVERTVWARNRSMDEQQPFEALGCLPSEDGMVIEEDDWMQMEGNLSEETARHVIGLQVDTVVTSPPFDAPWGKPISIRSTVSDGGDIILMAPE